MKLDPEVVRENRIMAIGCLVCSLLMTLGFLIAGKLDLSVLLGVVLGFALSFGNFFFMSVGITGALATGDETKAKRKMRLSYLIRTVILLGILALSLLTDRIHWIPVVAAVFYPRIIIAVRNFFARARGTEGVSTTLPDDEEDDEDDDYEDEEYEYEEEDDLGEEPPKDASPTLPSEKEGDPPEEEPPEEVPPRPRADKKNAPPTPLNDEEENQPDGFEKFVGFFSRGPIPGEEAEYAKRRQAGKKRSRAKNNDRHNKDRGNGSAE